MPGLSAFLTPVPFACVFPSLFPWRQIATVVVCTISAAARGQWKKYPMNFVADQSKCPEVYVQNNMLGKKKGVESRRLDISLPVVCSMPTTKLYIYCIYIIYLPFNNLLFQNSVSRTNTSFRHMEQIGLVPIGIADNHINSVCTCVYVCVCVCVYMCVCV